MRVTKSILDAQLQTINRLTKEEYFLEYSDSGVRLCKVDGDGRSEVSLRTGKSGMYYILDAIQNLLYSEKA